MLVNGAPPAPVIRGLESDPSGPAALETVNASGFSSLLFLILASPHLAASAPPRDGGAASDTALLLAGGKGWTTLEASTSAGGNNANGVDENNGYPSHTEKARTDSPVDVVPVSGKTVDEMVAPELLAPTDEGSGIALAEPSSAPYLSGSASSEAGLAPGRSGSPEVSPDELKPVQLGEPLDESSALIATNAISQSTNKPLPTGAPAPVDGEAPWSKSAAAVSFAMLDNEPVKASREPRNAHLVSNLRGAKADDRNSSENVIEGHSPRVRSQNEAAVFTIEQSETIGGKEMNPGDFAARITGEKHAALSGSPETIIDPADVPGVKLLFGAPVPESRPTPKFAVIANAPDDTSGGGPAVEAKLRFEKPANGDLENADTRPFGGQAKDAELAPAGRAQTQSQNEAANAMPRPILSRESTNPAADVSATPWRATVERVASEIAAHIQLNKREAILHLDPPELGKIKINLHLNGEKLQAHIFAEAQEARALIENHMSELRQALQSKNLDLVDVRVQGGWQGGMGEGMHGFPQQRHQHAAGQQETIWASGNALESEMVEPKASRSSKSIDGGVSMWA